MAGWFHSYVRWLTALLLFGVVSGASPCRVYASDGQVSTVAVVYTSKKSYRVAAQSLAKSVRASGRSASLIELPNSRGTPAWDAALQKLENLQPDLVATGGRVATEWALDARLDVPVVYFMVPNIRDASFLKKAGELGRFITGVSADVSPTAQVKWVQDVAPLARNIAILHSRNTQDTAEALEVVAMAQGLKFKMISAHRSRFPDAIRQLNAQGIDGVVMIPDAQVYNSATVQRLLIWGVRQKKPIWAFSGNVVRGGAVAGQYTEPHAIGWQTAQLLLEILKTGQMPDATWYYAAAVKHAVNVRIAEVIGLDLDIDRIGPVQQFGDAK